MKSEIIKLDAAEYGIEESKAKQIKAAFEPMAEMLEGFEGAYNDLIKEANEGVTPEISAQAKRLRLDVAQVRIGSGKIKDKKKEYIKLEDKAIMGVHNILVWAVTEKENKLKEIELHAERMEAERLEKIRDERRIELDKYNTEAGVGDLAAMSDDVWAAFIAGTKMNYDNQIAAEKKAEEERLAKIEADRIEQERIRKENEQLKKEADAREKEVQAERKRLDDIEAKRIAEEKKIEQARLKKEQEAEKERQRLAKIEQDKIDQLKKEIEAKEEKERQDKIDEENRIQAELKKGDSEKVNDLVNDLIDLKAKYSFKSASNKKMYSGVLILIDKVVDYIEK